MVADLRVGKPPITVRLRPNARAKRLILRLGPDGPVLTLPPNVTKSTARDFLTKNEAWLRSRLSTASQNTLVGHGAVLPVAGEDRTIVQGTGKPRLQGQTLIIPGPPAHAATKAATFLKLHAKARLTARSESHARALGRTFAKITLRDTKSRWGSCSSTGNLMYSWRLAMAPPEVLDYVAAHEVAHLVEFNHSRFFWRLVDDLCPEYPYHRAWLKEHGPALHSYRFSA